jgi:hypothetical protein
VSGAELQSDDAASRKPFASKESDGVELSIDLMNERYSALGSMIDRFETLQGKEAARPFVDRYKAIEEAYKQALRPGGPRRDVVKLLDSLAADLKRAEKR